MATYTQIAKIVRSIGNTAICKFAIELLEYKNIL
jgi:hypothetical protein